MSTKTKIILSIGSVCLVAVVAVVAIVAVFAARNQTFESAINVSYIAREVECTVSANWYEGTTGPNKMQTADKQDSITFKAGPGTTGSLSPTKEQIDLTADANYVVFEYVFVNTGKTFTATLTYTDTDPVDTTGIQVYAGYNATQLSPEAIKDGNDQVKSLENKSGTILTFTMEDGKTDNKTMYAYVVVKVPESALGSDASFSGKFVWNLETAVGKS